MSSSFQAQITSEVTRECAHVITEPITFEKLWQREEVRDAKRQTNIVLIFSERGAGFAECKM